MYPYMHPLHLTGFEGIWGIGFSMVIISSLSFVPCYTNKLCDKQTIVDIPVTFKQIGDRKILIPMILVILFTLLLRNFLSIAAAKYATAGQRASIILTIPVFVWITSMIIDQVDGNFTPARLIGYILLLYGMLIYNEVLVIPTHQLRPVKKADFEESSSNIDTFEENITTTTNMDKKTEGGELEK